MPLSDSEFRELVTALEYPLRDRAERDRLLGMAFPNDPAKRNFAMDVSNPQEFAFQVARYFYQPERQSDDLVVLLQVIQEDEGSDQARALQIYVDRLTAEQTPVAVATSIGQRLKLFVSYRRKSWAFTQRMAADLGKLIDADIFVDFSGIDSTDFEKSILRNLRNSDAVLLVVSEYTFADRIQNEEDWIRREIGLALELKRPIVLVGIDGQLPPAPADLPANIRDVTRMQSISFYPEFWDAAIKRLAEFVVKVTPLNLAVNIVAAPPSLPSEEIALVSNNTLEEALRLLDEGHYDKAIFLLTELRDAGFKSQYVNIDLLLQDAIRNRDVEQNQRETQQDYDLIRLLAQRRASIEQARTAWQAFRAQHPDFPDRGNLSTLLEPPAATPITTTLSASAPVETTAVPASTVSTTVPADVHTTGAAPASSAQVSTGASISGMKQRSGGRWVVAVAALLLVVVFAGLIVLSKPPASPSPTMIPTQATAVALISGATSTATTSATTVATTAATSEPTTAATVAATPQATSATTTEAATFAATKPAQLTSAPLQAGTERTDSKGVTQVFVPSGCYLRGSDAKDAAAADDEQPQHKVCITHAFWLDETDVTNAAFDAFVTAGGYSNAALWSTDGKAWKQQNKITGPEADCTKYSSDPQQPRVCVSYYEAEAYANWRNGRLPTEAEWEYAARGPNDPIYPWGNTWDVSKANTIESGLGATSLVTRYAAGRSWVGAYDMAGNVWQWVADCYGAKAYFGRPTPDNDPVNNTCTNTLVQRGGSWNFNKYNARAASRYASYPAYRSRDSGFRIVSGS